MIINRPPKMTAHTALTETKLAQPDVTNVCFTLMPMAIMTMPSSSVTRLKLTIKLVVRGAMLAQKRCCNSRVRFRASYDDEPVRARARRRPLCF